MSSKSNKQSISEAEGPEYEETRKNTSSRKVVDAADRARMKAELEAIMKEEEESNNRLEALRLQKSPKIIPNRGIPAEEMDHLNISQALESTIDIAEEKKKSKNRLKSKKKQAREVARKKKLESEIEKSRKVSSSLSTKSPVQENLNHLLFHEKIEHDNEENEFGELNEIQEMDKVDKEKQEEVCEEDEDFLMVTKDLECVSIGGSPSSVIEALPPPPLLELGEPTLSQTAILKGKLSKKKSKKNGSKQTAQEENCSNVSKKQAKEAAKARYAAFEAHVLPGLVKENPLMKMRDHRAQVAKLWIRSPENPDHPNHLLFLAHEQTLGSKS